MPNIRIKDIPTTASATSSTDFIGIDGSANGTRKLNAFSPTFGGNLTVSGTGTSSVAGPFGMGTASPTSFGAGYGIAELYNATNGPYFLVNNGTALVQFAVPTSTNRLELGTRTNHNILIVRNNSEVARFDASTTTLAGNLTVSGGTIGTAASTNLTLAGGSSGASLVLGQGTNGAATLTSNGSGRTTFTTPRTNTFGQLFTNSGTVAANDRVGFLFGFGGLYTNSGIAAQILDNGSTGAEDVVIYTGTNATGAGEAARFKNTGNFLLGTTTDGGQKLQVAGNLYVNNSSATHTVAQLNQSNASYNTDLNLSHVSAASSALISRRASGELWLYTTGADAIKCYTNSTLALTLDSSQNATFAGTINQKASKISAINETSVSTTATDIAIATSVGGLYFVAGYNSSNGAQGSWLLLVRGTIVTTVSSDNNTGLTLTFSMSSGKLQAATSSGTALLTCTAITRT